MHSEDSPAENSQPKAPQPKASVRGLVILSVFTLVAVLFLCSLGNWQLERREWKHALIERIEARVHAPPVDLPLGGNWADLPQSEQEYLHVRVSGEFLNDKETQVYGVTADGPGYWVMTPLVRPDGSIILVNRGFVPNDRRNPQTRERGQLVGPVTVTGLLRLSETKMHLFARGNDPASNLWYQRNVEQIARERGLGTVAPFFIDADNTPNPGGLPLGGLTQVVFTDNHLIYAITWFVLAMMVSAMYAHLLRREIPAIMLKKMHDEMGD